MSSLFRKGLWVVMLLSTASLFAQERKNTVGTTIDLTGGGTNRLSGVGLSPAQRDEPFFFFYGVYPSVNFLSTSGHSALDASYAFGLNRTETNDKLHSNSHSASLKFSLPVVESNTTAL